MRYKNNKILVIINTIAIFLFMFLFSNIYNWFPNFLTAIFFPVNESLFEHLKLMYMTQVIISLFVYLIFKLKQIKINNFFLGLLTSTIFTIGVFFLIYLPLYNKFGENLIMTMSLYFIVLVIGQYLFYLIMSKIENKELLNLISSIILPIIWLVLIYFTFNPMHADFFFDPIDEIYGISNK